MTSYEAVLGNGSDGIPNAIPAIPEPALAEIAARRQHECVLRKP